MFDVIGDMYQAVNFFLVGWNWCGALKIAFFAIPGATASYMSLKWYSRKDIRAVPTSKWQWVFRLVCVVLMVSTLER